MTRIRWLARFLPVGRQQALRRMYYGRQIRRGAFASDEVEFGMLDRYVREGDWVLDIGANVGHYTLRLSSLVGPEGRVLAFEPLPETFELLAANVRLSPYENITLFNMAASDRSRTAKMIVPQGRTGLDGHYFAYVADEGENGAGVGGHHAGEGGNHVARRVFCCSIDSFTFPRRIGLAKVDVEGHELEVLRGMQDLLRRDRPVLIVEAGRPAAAAFLRELGYAQEQFSGSHNWLFTAG